MIVNEFFPGCMVAALISGSRTAPTEDFNRSRSMYLFETIIGTINTNYYCLAKSNSTWNGNQNSVHA